MYARTFAIGNVALAALAALSACGKGGDGAANGAAAPAEACLAAAETLTTLELGNYASAENRAPKVAEYTQACVAAKLSPTAAACVATATDRDSLAFCPTPLLPGVTARQPNDCTDITTALRGSMQGEVAGLPPAIAKALGKVIDEVGTSCKRWPEASVACARQAATQAPNTFGDCISDLPVALRDPLSARIEAIMDTAQAEAEPGGGAPAEAPGGIAACTAYWRAKEAARSCPKAPPGLADKLVDAMATVELGFADVDFARLDEVGRARVTKACEQGSAMMAKLAAQLGCAE